ncbi:MAG: DNA replication and repair protein RecF [Clostridiales Family XIII bacterium]|jgi:DNA replication and repair protein RecF|nr:DNA replication and repair protein RecF [Clostridiales Family XIII bacterium]
MYVENVNLFSFRNYEKEEIEFSREGNIIIGENGSGKTSVLEAIYFLSFGKSFKTFTDKNLIKKGNEKAIIKGNFKTGEKELSILFEIDKTSKEFYVNKRREKNRENLLSKIKVINSSNEDRNIINGEPEKRRNFIDGEIFSKKASYYNTLLKYKKCLKSRNVLLKESRKIFEIEIWDKFLTELGIEIMEERKNEIIKKQKAAKKIYRKLGGEELEILYKPNIESKKNREEQKKEIVKVLKNNIKKDMEIGSTEKGPHKDEIKILINDKEAKEYASNGQKKLAVIALKLAEKEIIEEKNEKPIILLDDIFSEIDDKKRKKILNFIKGNQYIITATKIFENDEEKIINIKNGKDV